MKLRVGDRIVNIESGSSAGENKGKQGVVSSIGAYDGSSWYHISYDDGCTGQGSVDFYKLINSKTFMSKLIEKAKSLIRTEPEKSLIEKGVTDTNDTLTDDGKELFLDYLYRKEKSNFVSDAAVAALLSEKESKKE